jgi:hypothetical protein
VTTGEPAATPSRQPAGGEVDENLPAAVQAAVRSLGKSLNVASGQVEVVSFEEVTWRDSCLGLGGPAEMCLQALTPGFNVILSVDGKEYEIHTDKRGASLRLKGAAELGTALPGVDQPAAVLAALGVLSETLGIPVEQIKVVSAEEVQWANSCLDLGGPAEICAAVITPGFRVTLSAGGQEYVFHTDTTGEVVRQK